MQEKMSSLCSEHGAWNDANTLAMLLQEIEQTTCHSLLAEHCQLRRQGIAMLQTALQEADQTHAKEMVREVLKHDPNCLIAYSILAYLEPQMEDALHHHEVGLRNGKMGLQAQHIIDEEGRVTSFQEAFPYLRLLQSYALGLFQAGKWEEALQASRQLLQAEPSDPLGIREMKIPLLLLLGYKEQAAWQLQRFSGDLSLTLRVSQAYLAFMQQEYQTAKNHLQTVQLTNDLLLAWLAGEDGLSSDSVANMEAVYAYSQLFLLVEANSHFRDFCARLRANLLNE